MANKQKVYKSNFPIRDKAAVLIGCTAQEITNFVERTLKEFGISRAQLNVLHFLDTEPVEQMTVNQLREVLIDDSPNVSRMLNKMVDKGLVSKERQSDDQRIVHITLTEKGRRLHHQADEKISGHNVRLSPQECQGLTELLMKI